MGSINYWAGSIIKFWRPEGGTPLQKEKSSNVKVLSTEILKESDSRIVRKLNKEKRERESERERVLGV